VQFLPAYTLHVRLEITSRSRIDDKCGKGLNIFIHTWTPTFWCRCWGGYQGARTQLTLVTRSISFVGVRSFLTLLQVPSFIIFFWVFLFILIEYVRSTLSPWGRNFSYLTLGPELKISLIILFFFLILKITLSPWRRKFSYLTPGPELRFLYFFFLLLLKSLSHHGEGSFLTLLQALSLRFIILFTLFSFMFQIILLPWGGELSYPAPRPEM